MNNTDTIVTNGQRNDGLNVSFLRKRLKWNQEMLASKTGYEQKTISNYESLSIIPDAALKKIAEAFGVSVEFLQEFDILDEATNYTFEKIEQHGSDNSTSEAGHIIHNNYYPKELVERLLNDKMISEDEIKTCRETIGRQSAIIENLQAQLEAALRN